MERSHIPLPKWVLAVRLMTVSKKGISAHRMHHAARHLQNGAVHVPPHPRSHAATEFAATM
jgi:hypothetical protein